MLCQTQKNSLASIPVKFKRYYLVKQELCEDAQYEVQK